MNIKLEEEIEKFRVRSKICQASKQASTHFYGKLYCNKLEKKPLWDSCSFKKIVSKVSTEKYLKGTQLAVVF